MSVRASIHLFLFCAACILVMTGFLLSRSALSIGVIALIVNGFLQGDWKERSVLFFSNRFVVGITILFLLPFVSGLWSADTAEWISRCRIQLPLLLLPFALVLQKGFEKKHFVWISVLWIGLMFAGSVWSIVQYLNNAAVIHQLYHRSKVIPVLADGDHIRFSIGIVIAILLWLKIVEWKYFQHIVVKSAGFIVILWFILFLHIIGVKTGIIGFYLVLIPAFLWQLWSAGHKKTVVGLLLFCSALPFIAYNTLPTFRARMEYIIMDRQHWEKKDFTGTFSDGNRILSMRAGWSIVQQHALTGVGYGDVKQDVNNWFRVNADHIPVTERFLPLNQWLMAGSATGITGMVLFSLVIFLPLFSRQWQQNKQAMAFICLMNIIFMYECTIEDQFGVFVYGFFSMWWHLCNRLKNEYAPNISCSYSEK